MKKKLIENLRPTKTKRNGWIATVQHIEDILVLNIYKNRILQGKYGMNVTTYEFASYHCMEQKWTSEKMFALLGLEPYQYYGYRAEKKLQFNSKEEEKLVLSLLKAEGKYNKNGIKVIDDRELTFGSEKREKTERNRYGRVKEVMNQVPELPDNLEQWIYEKAADNADYIFVDSKKQEWICTSCKSKVDEHMLQRVDREKKIRHNDRVICPHCQKQAQVKKRNKELQLNTHITLLQPIHQEISVARHLDVCILWNWEGRKVEISEGIRIILHKMTSKKKYACELYYNQGGYFDNKSNQTNRRTHEGYLYETGIEEALENTCYAAWSRLFKQMAAAGKKVQYNKLMIAQNNLSIIQMVECLFKGRFDKLLQETAENISPWTGSYFGPLKIEGSTIEEVFDIKDKQKINRVRELNGGESILNWMRWSDATGKKIPQETQEWLLKNDIKKNDIQFIENKMNIQQIMNYVLRQQAEGYRGKTTKGILSQWEDYLRMCQDQKKNMSDEMVYKPRELRRRHDEIVEEINRQRMIEEMKRSKKEKQEEAKRMREKFPGAEENLKAVKKKYEYENDEYLIIVPGKLIDIMTEGYVLHHCTGTTDRYFDRIMQQETYICFLRKQSDPKVPYYTIEVEPGGTIRQHRGYLDEEPEIEKIKPFLKEWQQVIKKRMKEKDLKLAEISAEKRQKNIEELKEKNNTRVLNGLMEDFMEAI